MTTSERDLREAAWIGELGRALAILGLAAALGLYLHGA